MIDTVYDKEAGAEAPAKLPIINIMLRSTTRAG